MLRRLILAPIISNNSSPDKVFVVGVYHGYKKPTNFNDFLMPLLMKQTFYHYIVLTMYQMPLKFGVLSVVPGAQSRNYSLNNKHYNGYYGWGRFTQVESYVNNRMTVPVINFEQIQVFETKTNVMIITKWIPSFGSYQLVWWNYFHLIISTECVWVLLTAW